MEEQQFPFRNKGCRKFYSMHNPWQLSWQNIKPLELLAKLIMDFALCMFSSHREVRTQLGFSYFFFPKNSNLLFHKYLKVLGKQPAGILEKKTHYVIFGEPKRIFLWTRLIHRNSI